MKPKLASRALLCPDCYVKMKPVRNSQKIIVYYECEKCGNRILYSTAGH
ncbi:MAG: hypothetical protein ABSG33_10760 [Candidatus Bathyarchaeia archaeon]|jgi:predicted RNA-binding Zn-ribbon protein involved in translation (DUF1610 family)